MQFRFTKRNARFYGRKGGKAAEHKKSEKTIERERVEREQERTAQTLAFEKFLNSESGFFNGFDFVDVFHERIKKSDAISAVTSDDCGNANGVPVGADGVTVYFFVNPEKWQKIVAFNRSVYVF